jgi:hypothetical protein
MKLLVALAFGIALTANAAASDADSQRLKRDRIALLQALLKQHGLYQGTVDGVCRPSMMTAVEKYGNYRARNYKYSGTIEQWCNDFDASPYGAIERSNMNAIIEIAAEIGVPLITSEIIEKVKRECRVNKSDDALLMQSRRTFVYVIGFLNEFLLARNKDEFSTETIEMYRCERAVLSEYYD